MSTPTPRAGWTPALAALALALALGALWLAAAPGTHGTMMGGTAAGRQVAGMGAVDEETFLRQMVEHHAEAVAAARHLSRSTRPEVRAFGEAVVERQQAEIEQMRTWLARWYGGDAADPTYRPMMRDLTGLASPDLDRVFLEDMVPHHMTAVMMSQSLLARGTEHAEVAELARSIRDGQSREIVQMQRWLRTWFPGSSGLMPMYPHAWDEEP